MTLNKVRGKMESINVDSYADGVRFIHRDSVKKNILQLDVCIIGLIRYTLVALNVSVVRLIQEGF